MPTLPAEQSECAPGVGPANDPLVYLNGSVVRERDARISPFDRGFLFGEAIYEAIRFFNGRPVDMQRHVDRCQNGLDAVGIRFDAAQIEQIASNLMRATGYANGLLYVHVSGGVAIPRDHVAGPDFEPTVFGCMNSAPALGEIAAPTARTAKTAPDERWLRTNLKTTNLLANVLALTAAHRSGMDEALLVRDGCLTEGTRTNVFMVQDGILRTPPLVDSNPILPGVTRALVLDVAEDLALPVSTEPIDVGMLDTADEVFISSSRRVIDAITHVDGKAIHRGTIGAMTGRIFTQMRKRIARICGVDLK